MSHYPIKMKPEPRLPNVQAAAGYVGEAITAVSVLSSSEVRVITKRGYVTGSPDELLPFALRRVLGSAIKNASDLTMRDEIGEDVTYDPDSTAHPLDKPEPEEISDDGLSTKERRTLETFDRRDPEDEEQILETPKQEKFPQDLPQDHPKEKMLREMMDAAAQDPEGRVIVRRAAAGDIVIKNVEVVSDQFPEDDFDPDAVADVAIEFILKGKLLAQLMGKQERVLEKALKDLKPKQTIALLGQGSRNKAIDEILKAFRRPVNKVINEEAQGSFNRGARISWRDFDFADDTSYWSAKVDKNKKEIAFEVEVSVAWKWA